MKLNPTAADKRIESLDMLRGVSLLGILIANMLVFHTPYFYIDPHNYFSIPSDVELFRIVNIFVEASFYPIFAMMFGYGLNMQYEKALSRGAAFAPTMIRRLFILMIFGLLHALFIWSGDILFTYALLGFLMVAIVRIPAKWLFPLSFIAWIVPAAGMAALLKFVEKVSPESLMEGYVDIHRIELSISAYAHGTYGEALLFRISEWLLIGLPAALMGVFMVLPLIMFGAAFSKIKIFERAAEWKGRIAIVTVAALIAGTAIKSVPYTVGFAQSNDIIQQLIGGPVLAIGYGGIVILLCQIGLIRTIFRPVARAGRMSLTTYIMQSVIATLVFYGYGLGLYGKADIETGLWIAFGIFAIQVIFAELWFMKFRMGPLEWLWRRGTYGKNPVDNKG